jgi:hypothetical protein
MPELTEHQLRRLQSAADDIHSVIREIQAAKVAEVAPSEPFIRYAAVSSAPCAGAPADDIIVDCEPD